MTIMSGTAAGQSFGGGYDFQSGLLTWAGKLYSEVTASAP